MSNLPFKTAAEQADEREAASLAYWRERAAWTDAQFLADYCAEQRKTAQGQVAGIEQGMAAEKATMDYIKKYGTEEG